MRRNSSCPDSDRRRWMAYAGAAVLGLAAVPTRLIAAQGADEEEEMEVPAAEDLMREHGVLRRALLVYAEASRRLSAGKGEVSANALKDAATLFRSFGEDYHERSLEEQHVFPPLIEAGGANAMLAKTLKAQHARGREITDYILAVTAEGRIAAAQRVPLADTLAGLVLMYEHHTAIEDTVVFPAWKAAISRSQYEELSEQFEDLEHRMFGEDGFDDAVKRIAVVEQAFGLSDLNALTASPPPKAAP